MPLRIEERDIEGVHVFELRGRLVLGDESRHLRDAVNDFLSSGGTRAIINLDGVTFIDSAGLGALVAVHTSARNRGAALKLSNVGSKFQEVLQLTRLLTVFETYPNETAAVASFGAWCHCDIHGNYQGPPPCPKCVRSSFERERI